MKVFLILAMLGTTTTIATTTAPDWHAAVAKALKMFPGAAVKVL